MQALRAKTLDDVIRLAGPEPLSKETWSLYVDTDEARGGRIVPRTPGGGQPDPCADSA